METLSESLILNSFDAKTKEAVKEAIKKNDRKLAKQHLKKCMPQENLKGKNAQPAIHFACHWNSDVALAKLIKNAQKHHKDHFADLVNLRNHANNTAAHIAARKKAKKCLVVLAGTNVVDLDAKNGDGETVMDLLQKNCSDLVELFTDKESDQETKVKKVKDTRLKDLLEYKRQKFFESKEGKKMRKKFEAVTDEEGKDVDLLDGVSKKSKVYEILKECQKTLKPFIDPDFPHDIRAINPPKEDEEKYAELVWMRPHQFLKVKHNQVKLFDKIEPADIRQGGVSVCYFLSSLACIAQQPSLIEDMFVNKVSNIYGAYGVKFYIQGIPTEIVVDDWLPCHPSGKTKFSHPNGNELWAVLLEKAFAKSYGDYYCCRYGFLTDACEYLLGSPSKAYMCCKNDEDTLWDIVMDADSKNHFMGACTSKGKVSKAKDGLVGAHVYSILGAYEVGKIRLLKMRNPWGKVEWKGDYSDDSDKWTDDLKEEVGFAGAQDDGIFYIQFSDFREKFGSVQMNMHHEDYKYDYYEVTKSSKKSGYFKFKVKEETEVYFRIHQEELRHGKLLKRTHKHYSPAILLCARDEGNGNYIPMITNPKDLDRDTLSGDKIIYPCKASKLTLQPGNYILRTKVYWRKDGEHKYVVSTYSSNALKLQAIDSVKGFTNSYLNHVLEDKKMQEGNKVTQHWTHFGPYYCYRFDSAKKKDKILHMKLNKCENLVLKKLTMEEDIVKVDLPSNGSSTFYFRLADFKEDPSIKFDISYK